MITEAGFGAAEVRGIRQRVGRRVLRYNAVLWDWCHLGLYDLLQALTSKCEAIEAYAKYEQDAEGDARAIELRAQADRQAADDMKNIGSGEASARKSKNGTGLINLGYAYVTLGQHDKGIALIQEGIAKGGLQNAEDAKLRLGYSYALAGKKEEAIKTLQSVQGADGRGDLARYWTIWVNRPAAGAAPAPAAS